MKLLLDTHVWIWYLAGCERLPMRFRYIISSSNTEVWLSPISVWETLVLAKKGKISLMPDPLRWVDKVLKRWPVKEAYLNIAVAIESQRLDLPHQDPADRFIAATALIYGLRLMTLDERLCSEAWLPTVEL
ncbi:MAG: type II toxin-antitoxin system VapC family toxin [Deltaproteobacteria bacterium]|nr:type II toxin-antitoxin system VapC family toxin [Deltaproteobacteria bacterium]